MFISLRNLSLTAAISIISNNVMAQHEGTDQVQNGESDVKERSIEQLLEIEVFTASKFKQKTI